MKKFLVLIIFIFAGLLMNAQEEKNGTVYIKHPSIEKTKQLWNAILTGDKAAAGALLADSLRVSRNGSENLLHKDDLLNGMGWWSENFDNLKIADDTPAYPDAIEYKKGGLWVQDWLLLTGTHKASGINLNLRIHNLYSFDKDGKIRFMSEYYNNDVFEAINNSTATQENGKVYINHPDIIKVRKLANAYCAKDLNAMQEYYAPDARFSNSAMDWGKSVDLEARKKEIQSDFDQNDNIKMSQIGYPDCIYYAKNDLYVVYSWWNLTATNKSDGKKLNLPLLLSHTFNKDGKIVDEMAYYSTNHFEAPKKTVEE